MASRVKALPSFNSHFSVFSCATDIVRFVVAHLRKIGQQPSGNASVKGQFVLPSVLLLRDEDANVQADISRAMRLNEAGKALPHVRVGTCRVGIDGADGILEVQSRHKDSV